MSKDKRDPNYRALFVIGLSLFGGGISLTVIGLNATGIAILSVGIVFFIIGITNRKKWVSSYDFKPIPEDENQNNNR